MMVVWAALVLADGVSMDVGVALGVGVGVSMGVAVAGVGAPGVGVSRAAGLRMGSGAAAAGVVLARGVGEVWAQQERDPSSAAMSEVSLRCSSRSASLFNDK